MDRALLRASTAEISKLEYRVAFLATTASITPYIGLFGTVWGIMAAFQGIATAGSTSLAVVAPPIAEALVATAAGLFAAIPAVYFYNDITSVGEEVRQRDGRLLDGVPDDRRAELPLMPKLEPMSNGIVAAADAARDAVRVSSSLAEINVVPLVDVMLVLLVIFMVAAPMMQQGFPVNLPQSRQSRAIDAPVVVTVPISFRRDRRVQVDEEFVGVQRARRAGAAGRRRARAQEGDARGRRRRHLR